MSTPGEDAALGTKTLQDSLSDYLSQVKMEIKYIRHLQRWTSLSIVSEFGLDRGRSGIVLKSGEAFSDMLWGNRFSMRWCTALMYLASKW